MFKVEGVIQGLGSGGLRLGFSDHGFEVHGLGLGV